MPEEEVVESPEIADNTMKIKKKKTVRINEEPIIVERSSQLIERTSQLIQDEEECKRSPLMTVDSLDEEQLASEQPAEPEPVYQSSTYLSVSDSTP